ncbi:hypothetical protein [Chamaesiphon polymorphus]|uniref:Chromosome segregation ATPase n=1 Tax=Chamaesiphon polymorphus CCALA 037 TaxID=2107692 RepID=A0A2T1GNU5_9CYAN|nr:hypothetical protein [Chamaesiphon polymorphus]PSB59521.1 hypothetical protein C7B77_00570 [Chamaesiphon polymorphus CCALA 037]
MENSNRQAIGTQIVSAWKKFQSRRSARDSGEVDLPDRSSAEADGDDLLADPSGYLQADAASQNSTVTAMSKIFDKDLFSDVVAPISKLNLPTVTLNPWSAFWAVLAAMVGGTGITSYLLLIAVPPTPTCQGTLPVSTDAERLYCAQVGADTQEVPKLRIAVDLVKDWTDRHPLYRESQRLLKEWSEDLTRAGRKQLNEGQIGKAIATLKIIPPTSPIYDRTQETIAKWSIQAQDSASIDAKFERAMKTGDWNQAFVILQSVQRMRGSYWSGFKHDKMSAKLAIERDAWDKLQEAKDALVDKDSDDYNTRAKRMELAVKAAGKKGKEVEVPLPQQPEPIVKAMKLANLIDPSSYAYQEGQTLRSKWSRHLVGLSVDLYKQQNFNDAIEIVQKVPQDVSIYAEAQDWVKLNQAHVWAGKRHMLAMVDAIAQVKKIPKTSPIYTLARTKQSNWRSMLKQQTQLQWARSIASFQQPATLAMAIETAKQVPAQSEVGQTIQSEVATWNRQIETIDNRVIFAKAKQIVNKGDSLGNLKAAVKLAGKITKDRPLGEEITAAVAEWNEKIQTIEDRPILNNAIATAQGGNLAGAIEIANRIAPGRSLYRDAQAEVRYWRLELQEIADRRTLERAINIYRQGKISVAIDLAATIGRRSPIYSDARSYVANWRLLLTPRSVGN